MYAFARTPKWIAGHVLVIVLLTIFLFAGFWQWSRHQWRQDLNQSINSRSELPALSVEDLSADPGDVEYRVATVTGAFTGPDVLVHNRTLDAQPGCHVLSTLETSEQAAVIVNRGWLPLSVCEQDNRTTGAAPAGVIELTGRVRETQTRGRFGPVDSSDGVLETMARVDVERLQQQVEFKLAPVYLEQIVPAAVELPTELPEPATDAGPHLGYTVQWFSFAAVAIIGYPLVLRKQARPTTKRNHSVAPDRYA